MRALLLILITACLSNIGLGQDARGDSLLAVFTDESKDYKERIKSLNYYYYYYTADVPDRVLEISDYHRELAQASGDDEEQINSLNYKAKAYYVKGNIESAMISLEESLKISEATSDSTSIALLLANMGVLESERLHYEKAFHYYKKSLSLGHLRSDYKDRASVLNNIGNVFFEIEAPELAFMYLDSARTLYGQEGTHSEVGNNYLSLGLLQFKKGKLQQSMQYCRLARNALFKANDKYLVASTYFQMAEIFKEWGNLDSARYCISQSLSLQRGLGNQNKVTESHILFNSFLGEDETDLSQSLIDSVKSSLPMLSSKKTYAMAYGFLYEKYKERGDLIAALEMNEMYALYQDSLKNEAERLSIVRQTLDESYGKALKKQEIQSQKAQSIEASYQNKRAIGIISLGLLIIAVLIWIMKKKSTRQEQEKLELLRQLEEFRNKTHSLSTENQSVSSPSSNPQQGFYVNREKVEHALGRALNDTDWNVLTILSEDPVISNLAIAEKAFISIDGIGSSLRRMYVYFEVKESKYKKISLLLEAVKASR